MAKTQIRLEQLKGEFGTDNINDQHQPSADLANVTNNDLNDVLSAMASSIRRLNGGTNFNDQELGHVQTDWKPATDMGFTLGHVDYRWQGAEFTSGSIRTDVAEMQISGSGSIVYSAPLLDDTISHNFKGVGLELDSLAADYASYTGMVTNTLYHVDGGLYWGNTLLNAGYVDFKEVYKMSSALAADSSLVSNTSFGGFDVSDIPSASRVNGIDVYVNGQLLVAGSSAEVTARTADVYIDVSTPATADLVFGFALEASDVIVVQGRYTANSAASPEINGNVLNDQRADLLSEGQGTGEVVHEGDNADGTLTHGALYYLSGTTWYETDCDDVTKGSDKLLAIALGTSVSDGMLISGFYHAQATQMLNWAGGDVVFIGATTGTYDTTTPSTGQFSRIIGHCTSTSNIIRFNPQQGWLEL
jgi:hypothetical protein